MKNGGSYRIDEHGKRVLVEGTNQQPNQTQPRRPVRRQSAKPEQPEAVTTAGGESTENQE